MRRGPRPGAGPLLMLLLVFLITAGMAALVTAAVGVVAFGTLFSPIAPVLLGIVLIHLVSRQDRRRRRLRHGGAAGTVPLPPRRPVPPPPPPDAAWRHARARFHALRGEYAAYECNTMEVLRLPALSDVAVPSTARFVDAFAEAQALETDGFPYEPHAGTFVRATERAWRAWAAARDAAERIRLSGLTPEERHTIERVVKLLTTARDSDSDPERQAAYSLARSELAKLDGAGVIHLPRSAKAALDASARGELSA